MYTSESTEKLIEKADQKVTGLFWVRLEMSLLLIWHCVMLLKNEAAFCLVSSFQFLLDQNELSNTYEQSFE